MPQYVLRRTWHTDVFYRTINIDGRPTRLAFRKREPIELTDEQLAAVHNAGTAPIEQYRPPAGPVSQPQAATPLPPQRPKKGK
jgi:hypothetical protein